MTAAVAIIDPHCPAPYTSQSQLRDGGAEAVVLRVTEALRAECRFHFYQNGRGEISRDALGFYRPLDALKAEDLTGVSNIIVINSWRTALKVRRLAPHCPIFLWLHRKPSRNHRRMGAEVAGANIEIVCVSHTHATEVEMFLRSGGPVLPKISTIYDPVPDDLIPDASPRDVSRMLFPGLPQKGLSEVLVKFAELRKVRPALKLDVGETGDLVWPERAIPEGVRFLGRLSPQDLENAMRRTLCLFCPQTRFGNLSGVTFARAHAVGTPVIAHSGTGINDELLQDAGQCVDTADTGAMIERIDSWQQGFPQVTVNPRFRLSQVAEAWLEKLSPLPQNGLPARKEPGGAGIALGDFTPATPSR